MLEARSSGAASGFGRWSTSTVASCTARSPSTLTVASVVTWTIPYAVRRHSSSRAGRPVRANPPITSITPSSVKVAANPTSSPSSKQRL
jgi:hypothetical protein